MNEYNMSDREREETWKLKTYKSDAAGVDQNIIVTEHQKQYDEGRDPGCSHSRRVTNFRGRVVQAQSETRPSHTMDMTLPRAILIGAAMLSVAILGGVLFGDRYQIARDSDSHVWKLDKLTGTLWACYQTPSAFSKCRVISSD